MAFAVTGLMALLVGCRNPTPPLLKDVSAGGGWWGACPPETEDEARAQGAQPLAISPDFDRRLSQSFPPGSNEKPLVETLRNQGFELLPPCKRDTTIRVAAFNEHGGGTLSSPVTANVFWKVDGAGNILWTKGFVRFRGL